MGWGKLHGGSWPHVPGNPLASHFYPTIHCKHFPAGPAPDSGMWYLPVCTLQKRKLSWWIDSGLLKAAKHTCAWVTLAAFIPMLLSWTKVYSVDVAWVNTRRGGKQDFLAGKVSSSSAPDACRRSAESRGFLGISLIRSKISCGKHPRKHTTPGVPERSYSPSTVCIKITVAPKIQHRQSQDRNSLKWAFSS